jgi:hypothetical protein
VTDYAVSYAWDSGTAPPTAGEFCSDSRNWSGASQVIFNEIDTADQDLREVFTTLSIGDSIRVEQASNTSNWRLWTVGGVPVRFADGTWTIAVSSSGNGGNNPSNGQAINVMLSVSALVPATASWAMAPDGATHWWSEVGCVHGFTRHGVWTNGPLEDDRNFLSLAPGTFANHQSLHPDCDCSLEIDWEPSYAPPTPAATLDPTLDPPRARSRAVGGATFTLRQSMPKLYGATTECQHGWSQAGVWQGETVWPDATTTQNNAVINHQRLMGCNDAPGAPGPSKQASVSFPQLVGIKPDTTAALAQTAVQVAAPFALDTFGRLSLSQAGLLSVSATFYLQQSVAQGASGIAALRLADAATPDLTAPSVATAGLVDAAGHATATLCWTGNVPANTSFEVDYWNGSAAWQDVQGGNLLVTLQ